MPVAPAPSPSVQALQRVLKISRANGWSVAVVAGLAWLVAAALGDLTGVLVGALAVVSGAMEIRGHRQLRRGDAGGMAWLVRAQLLLLGVILAYSMSRLVSFDRELMLANLTPDMRDALNQLGMKPEELMPLIQRVLWAFYGAVMLTTCLYQGGLAVFYRRRTPLVAEALAVPPSLPPAPPAVPPRHRRSILSDDRPRLRNAGHVLPCRHVQGSLHRRQAEVGGETESRGLQTP